MRVALIHDFLTSYTGAERVLKVLADMYPAAPIYTLLYDRARCKDIFPPERVRPSRLQKLPEFIRKRRRYLLPWMSTAIESFDLSAFDLVISSSGAWSKGVITKPSTVHVCYCHAPMRYAWDWHGEYLEEHNMRGVKKFLALRMLNRIRLWDFYSSKRPDAWIANSRTTQERLAKYYRVNATVIFPPVDQKRFTSVPPSPHLNMRAGSFYLIVSRLEPYKRIDLALAAFKTLPQEHLVIIGEGSAAASLRALAGPNVTFLGYQPDDTVTSYYHASRALIFPGEDDLGIAPLEAMCCGKPVVAFARGGATETVLDGQTGILFTEQTAEALRAAILRTDTIHWNADTIRDHAALFDTSAFQARMETFVSSVVSSSL